jgi:predicted DNA-binding transcriptional regulator AlpA
MVTLLDFDEMAARNLNKYCRDHTRRLSKKGLFPKPVVLSRDPSGRPRRIAWVEEDVVAYNNALIAERDALSAEDSETIHRN